MENERESGANLTLELVERALQIRYQGLPEAVRLVARDCLIDWLGCTFAGRDEPASEIVAQTIREEGGAAQATLIGHACKASVSQAALVNGVASHALDYDDVNLSLPGHLSVAIIPGLLALAEHRQASRPDFYAAFVAGYDLACRVGALVEPAHYVNGFHATATIGSLGATMACAHLLGMQVSPASHALGVAATQAAGLKAMFGSMAKPLHAGLAAQVGVRSALLAEKGFISRHDALECVGGFAQAHGQDFRVRDALQTPAGGYHLLNNIFKFHAACFGTHSTIAAMAALRNKHAIQGGEIERIQVHAPQACTICNLQSPSTALEAKFSLRAAAAFAALGMDTAVLSTWQRVTDPDVRFMLERVRVDLVPGTSLSESVVAVHTRNGRVLELEADVGRPLADKAEQSRRVAEKFNAIAAPVIRQRRCRRSLEILSEPDRGTGFSELLRECFD